MRSRFGETEPRARQVLPTDAVAPLFQAVLEATEEAVYNSLFQATTVTSKFGTGEAKATSQLASLVEPVDESLGAEAATHRSAPRRRLAGRTTSLRDGPDAPLTRP